MKQKGTRVKGLNHYVSTFNYNGLVTYKITPDEQKILEDNLVSLVQSAVGLLDRETPMINICLLNAYKFSFRIGKATKDNYGLRVYMPFPEDSNTLRDYRFQTIHLSIRISNSKLNKENFDKITRGIIIEKLKELFEQHYAQ